MVRHTCNGPPGIFQEIRRSAPGDIGRVSVSRPTWVPLSDSPSALAGSSAASPRVFRRGLSGNLPVEFWEFILSSLEEVLLRASGALGGAFDAFASDPRRNSEALKKRLVEPSCEPPACSQFCSCGLPENASRRSPMPFDGFLRSSVLMIPQGLAVALCMPALVPPTACVAHGTRGAGDRKRNVGSRSGSSHSLYNSGSIFPAAAEGPHIATTPHMAMAPPA